MPAVGITISLALLNQATRHWDTALVRWALTLPRRGGGLAWGASACGIRPDSSPPP